VACKEGVSEAEYLGSASSSVCVWYYSTGGALCLSTEFGGKEAKAGFTVCSSGHQTAFKEG
jgi:hypothetical protein